MKKKKIIKVSRQEMLTWLKNQITDMDRYDPRDDMEEGDHGIAAIGLVHGRREDNRIVEAIILQLKKMSEGV